MTMAEVFNANRRENELMSAAARKMAVTHSARTLRRWLAQNVDADHFRRTVVQRALVYQAHGWGAPVHYWAAAA